MQSMIENNITQRTDSSGLTASEVLVKRNLHGENRLPVEKTTPAWAILLSQVKSPLVYIILVAALAVHKCPAREACEDDYVLASKGYLHDELFFTHPASLAYTRPFHPLIFPMLSPQYA